MSLWGTCKITAREDALLPDVPFTESFVGREHSPAAFQVFGTFFELTNSFLVLAVLLKLLFDFLPLFYLSLFLSLSVSVCPLYNGYISDDSVLLIYH